MMHNYNPDVLEALANLSNDEVFTPPKLANQMLDLLPEGIWSDSSIKILDPATKSGVFLREAAKRFLKGLESQIPDLQERINHICTKQLFGIGITELTALLSRRSLYCSKFADGKYSIATEFSESDGHIKYERREHNWKWDTCIDCWASRNVYDRGDELETHAYAFIHQSPEEITALFWWDETMKFDVIIGNPPYQLSDGGYGASAKPIYHYFVQQAKKLNPRYLSMIIPSRWFAGWKGLDTFRDEMINDKYIEVLHDFTNSKEVFNGVDIKGWVCYFLRNNERELPCKFYIHDQSGELLYSERYLSDWEAWVVIRYQECLDILKKVQILWELSLKSIISSRKPYWLSTDFFKNPIKYGLPNALYTSPVKWWLTIHGLEGLKRVKKYVVKNYPIVQWLENLDKYKVFIGKAYGCWALGEVIPSPILASPMELCTETFIQMWGFTTEKEAINAMNYLKTKFFRLLVWIKKTTQNTTKDTYSCVPMQDFTQERTDEKLYQKYGLTQNEIDFIETMVAPMD